MKRLGMYLAAILCAFAVQSAQAGVLGAAKHGLLDGYHVAKHLALDGYHGAKHAVTDVAHGVRHTAGDAATVAK